MKQEEDLPIILGKTLLCTAVDIHNSRHTLRVGDKEITFGVKKESINLESNDDVFFLEEVGKEKEENNELVELKNLMEEELMNWNNELV